MSSATQRQTGDGYEVLLGAVEADADGTAEPMPVAEREPAPWESSMEAVCESLALRGALDNLERRNAEDELGQTAYAGSPIHTRPVLATAHSLLDRGVISEDELRAKMEDVRVRFEAG